MKENNKNEMSPIWNGLAKMFILSVIVGGVILYSDVKGYFNPNQANDHTKRKWDAFYEMQEEDIHIDVMLFGNSHLYTGINPKNLSLALGANAFIFASPGTITVDNYFALKEAVKVQKPSLVIIETYGLNDKIPEKLVKGSLSNQIVSFSARKDFVTKLKSTPALFALDNYAYAWSTTIRNHDYIFSDPAQLKMNREIISNPNLTQTKPGLYLGRYVRFTSGIEEEVLIQYQKDGAPVDGSKFEASEDNVDYTHKIIELCKKENIKLLFLTLPMYEKHIKNYDTWNAKLADIINKKPTPWLNLQREPHYTGFGPFAFENTYKESQHMTYNGSLLATYKLADYIRDTLNYKLPDRTKDIAWHQLFYGGEGYFENYLPANNDTKNKLISTQKQLQNVKLNSFSSISLNNGQSTKLIAKIDRAYFTKIPDNQSIILKLNIQYENNGTIQSGVIELRHDRLYYPKNEIILSTIIGPIKVREVLDGAIELN